MATIDNLRNNLIDKLMSIDSKGYLEALNKLVDNSSVNQKPYILSEPQIEMLKLSDEDIANNRLISHEDLNEQDLKWLNDQ